MELMRLVYASRAKADFNPIHVGAIVKAAEKNNPNLGLTGVLFFSDNCFFQCLEGERANINQLLRKLYRDDQHNDLEILLLKEVTSRHFEGWDMKLLSSPTVKQEIVNQTGQTTFDPYKLNTLGCENLLNAFVKHRRILEQGQSVITEAPQPVAPPRSKFFLLRWLGA